MRKLNFRNGLDCWGILWALSLASVLAFLPAMAHAQVTTATLSGTVQDSSGAVIPGANVTLKDQTSVYTRKQSTNADGFFRFVAVPSATYTLTVDSSGFASFVESDIHLDPGDSRALSHIRLTIGATSQEVTVSATQGGIPLDTGALSTTISADEIQKLSVEGRDVTELMKILPGFAVNGQGASNTAYDPSIVTQYGATLYGSYIANGTGRQGTDMRLDGAEISSVGYGELTVNTDMISETQIQTSNFTADVSNGPTVMNSVTTSGTTAFHGTIYTYARTYQLNSFDWLAKYLGQAKAPDRDIYPGATFGGPVLIPGTNFNRDKKLTFFVGAEDYAQRSVFAYENAASALVHALVPTAAMRTGDFSAAQLSAYLGPNYGTNAYNNITHVPTVAKNGTAIVNGQIPDIDPGGQALINLMPLPNVPSNAGGFNYVRQNLENFDTWEGVARIDWAKSERNHLFGRYAREKGTNGVPQSEYYSPSGPMGGFNTPGGGITESQESQSAVVNFTTQFTPTLTNELYGSFIYNYTSFVPNTPSMVTSAGIGYPYHGAYAGGSKAYPQLQDYGFDGLPLALFPDFTIGPLYSRALDPIEGDNLTKVWGRHTVEVGTYIERSSSAGFVNPTTTNGAIAQYYNGFPTMKDINGNVNYTSGNYLANFLEGIVFSYQQQNLLALENTYYWNVDGYAEDTWKVRPNLTLNYGLRLEHLGMANPGNNLGIAVFDPSQINNTALPIPGFVWHGVDPSVPLSGVSSYPVFFEPRVGFAWDIFGNGKTVLRGGYGTYRSADGAASSNAAVTSQGLNGIYESGSGGVTLAAINALALPPNSGSNNGLIHGLTKGDNEQPQTKNYSLSIDRTLPHNTIAQISYVGNNSDFILNGVGQVEIGLDNINAIPLGGLYKPNPVTGAPAPTVSGPNSVDHLTTTEVNDYRPYPRYGQLSVPKHNDYSNYNGIQVVLQHHSGPVLLNLNYTFSKAMGILGSDFEIYEAFQVSSVNQAANYAPLSFDRSQIFNVTYAYTFGNYVKNRLAGLIVNGWMLSGITNLESGANMQTSISEDPNFYLAGRLGPNGNPNQISVDNKTFLGTPDVSLQPTVICNPKSGLGKYQYVNGACFGLPNIGQNGQYIFPYMHGPAYFNSDLTAQKAFKFEKDKSLQFRIAAFNFLNHPLRSFTSSFPNQYGLNLSNFTSFSPGSAVYQPSSGFGFAPYKVGRRVVELSAKFIF